MSSALAQLTKGQTDDRRPATSFGRLPPELRLIIADYLTDNWTDHSSFRQVDRTNHRLLTTARLISTFATNGLEQVLHWTISTLIGPPCIQQEFLGALLEFARIELHHSASDEILHFSLVPFWKICGDTPDLSDEDDLHHFIQQRVAHETLVHLGSFTADLRENPYFPTQDAIRRWFFSAKCWFHGDEAFIVHLFERVCHHLILINRLQGARGIVDFTLYYLAERFRGLLESQPRPSKSSPSSMRFVERVVSLKAIINILKHMMLLDRFMSGGKSRIDDDEVDVVIGMILDE